MREKRHSGFPGYWVDVSAENHNRDELVAGLVRVGELEIMLPGIPPTGRKITVPVVVVVGFEDGKVKHEHIYWDQAAVLIQAGLLDPSGLPVTGADQSEALLDQQHPKNELLSSPT